MRNLFTFLPLAMVLGFSSFAEAHCRDTDVLLEDTGRLTTMVAELKHDVELVAFGTPAAADLAQLRTKLEGFYDDIYGAHKSCDYLKRRFADIDGIGRQAVGAIEGQGLTADNEINGGLVGMRFGLYNVGLVVDRLN